VFLQGCKSTAKGGGHEAHEGEIKVQLTAYTSQYEVFGETDPLVADRECTLLAHFTRLSDFKPVVVRKASLSLTVDGETVEATTSRPLRPGICQFAFMPKTAGKGRMTISIDTDRTDRITIDDLTVHPSEEVAHRAESAAQPQLLAVTFTKEKSWKVDFATDRPQVGAFGEVIKTFAQIQSAQGDEVIVTAKADGMVNFSGEQVLEGKSLTAGQGIFSISGGGLAENNMGVRFAEAQNNFERAQTEYKRAKDLAKDRIVSEKDLLTAKTEYENTRAAYDNLKGNFIAAGQVVTAPITGFIKQVFVKNGQFVTAGQAIVTVSQNRKLLLRADVRQKFAAKLGSIVSATIRTLHDNRSYTLEELNGKILSYGHSVNPDNYLVPINVQIDNLGHLLPGGFVEIRFKTAGGSSTLSVPDTAILEEQGNCFVFVQLNPEQFEKREIRIGDGDGLRTEVLAGLTRSDRVVTKGAIWVKLAESSGALDPHAGHVH